jgi:hypothetical protein
MNIKVLSEKTTEIDSFAKKNINKRKGIIVMLDALGSRNYTNAESIEFIANLHEVIRDIESSESILTQIHKLGV